MMYLNGAYMLWGMYYTNQSYFEINCVNKDNPQLKCNGKCQAAKEVEDLTQKQDKVKENIVFPLALFSSSQHYKLPVFSKGT